MINELTFNELKEKSKNFKYSLFDNCIYDSEIESANIIRNDEKLILIFKEQEGMTNIYFAADSAGVIINAVKDIKDNIKIGFLPSDFVEDFESVGFIVWSDWIDFFNNDIINTPTFFKDYNAIQFLQPDEHELIKEMTNMCVGQSRGFEAEKEKWFTDWMKINDIIILKEGDILIGYNCVSVYDYGSGVTVWVRRIAVKPEYQGKGYGNALIEQALVYGIAKGATRSFLAADVLNNNAVALYKKYGFVPQSEEHGEITMKRFKK
jgi:Acetyltransferases